MNTDDQSYNDKVPAPLLQRLKAWWNRPAIDPDALAALLEADEEDRVEQHRRYEVQAREEMSRVRLEHQTRLRRARISKMADMLMLDPPVPGAYRLLDQAVLAVRKATDIIDAVDQALAAELDQNPPQ